MVSINTVSQAVVDALPPGPHDAMRSVVPADISPAVRLREYLALVRDLSEQTDPHELMRAYRARSRFVLAADSFVSLSRKGLPEGQVRITRAARWEEIINPWKQPERLPIIDGGILQRLSHIGRPVKIDQLELADDDPAAPYFEGMNSILAVPIFHQGEPLYAVVMMRQQPAAFTLDELATLLLTANLVGRATSHLVMAEELRAAHAALDREARRVGEIQRGLLPATPEVDGLRVATYYETSTRAGGDYYDFVQVGPSHWGFLIADVSGHGPPAAVVMAMMQAFMRTASGQVNAPELPSRVLATVNRELYRSLKLKQFVTAFFGVLNTATREFSYAAAGHPAPRLVRPATRAVLPLPLDPGLPLGIVENHESTTHTLSLREGERLMLFTDGITETFNAARDMFGTDGMDRALTRCTASPQSMIECVLAELRQFAGSDQAQDDRTLVALAFD